MLVVIKDESGEIKAYERVEVVPNRIEYRRVPCEVIGNSKRRMGLSWKVAAIAGGVWLAQFGADKIFEFVFQVVIGVVAG